MHKRFIAYQNSLRTLGIIPFFESRLSNNNFVTNSFGFNLSLRPNTDDEFILQEILLQNRYELPPELLERVKRKGHINVIEIGAHIGISTTKWLSQIPQGVDHSTILVEAHPKNYELLVTNMNQFQNITCLNAAISSCSGEFVTISTPTDHKGVQLFAWTNSSLVQGENPYSVETVTLENVLANYCDPIDLLIFDAEGAETHVNWAECLPRIHTLFIETHDHLKPGCSDSLQSALVNSDHRLVTSFDENNFLYINRGLDS